MTGKTPFYFQRLLLLASCGLVSACAVPPPAATPQTCIVTAPIKPVICTQQYEPVCGCDGKTYSNACTAKARGVSDSLPGSCEALQGND